MTDTLAPQEPVRGWLARPRETALAALALGTYYALSMSPDMSVYDSPELALVAVQGGVGHPIGQPLHTLLGHLLVLAGGALGVAPLLCLNLLSALATALTVLPVVSVIDRVAPSPSPGTQRARPFVVALLGMHASLWEPATRIEVYPLGTLLGALSLSALLLALDHAPGRARTRSMALAGLLLALATGANIVTAAFFALAMLPLVAVALARKTLTLRAIVPAVLAAIVAMLVWVYVPLAARDPDVVAWGRPSDWPALRAYLTGADYQGKSVALLSPEFASHVIAFVSWAARVGLLALPLLGLFGFGLRARRLLPAALLLLVLNVGWYARYDPYSPGVLDYLGYLGAPLWLSAGGCALLVEWAHGRSRVMHGLALLTLLAVVALAAPAPWERTRHLDQTSRVLAESALRELPPHAVLLVEADHAVGPLLYLQEVEAQRPDVVVLPLGLASSSWLWELVYRRHPDLAPFALRGPGGREARVQRFLAAQPARAAFTLHRDVALRVGAPGCVHGVLLTLAPCTGPARPDGLAPLLSRAHALLADGSPGAAALLAWEAETRARALAAEGRARDAFALLTLTVPSVPSSGIPERTPPFELPASTVVSDGMGSYQRNLLRAADLALLARQPHVANALRTHAETAPR